MTSGPVPIGDPFLNKTRSCAVVGKKLGLCFAGTWKLLLQHPHDAGVKLLAPGAQQGAIGGVLYQRVLEGVLASGGVPRRNISSARTSCSKASSSSWLRHFGDGTDQLMGELPPERRCDLRHFSRRRQSIEPGQKRGLERRWDRQGTAGPVME